MLLQKYFYCPNLISFLKVAILKLEPIEVFKMTKLLN